MATAYEDALQRAASLSPDDQLRLIEELMAHTLASHRAEFDKYLNTLFTLVRQRGVPASASASSSAPASLLELEGLGAEIWRGIDAQEYVTRERASWRG